MLLLGVTNPQAAKAAATPRRKAELASGSVCSCLGRVLINLAYAALLRK